MNQVSRRKFILAAGATAASSLVINACKKTEGNSPKASTSPAITIAPADAPEVTTAKLGFIALTDSAPLIIAKEKGLFAKYGMKDVEILKQASWPVTRDNLQIGGEGTGIDGVRFDPEQPEKYLKALKIKKVADRIS